MTKLELFENLSMYANDVATLSVGVTKGLVPQHLAIDTVFKATVVFVEKNFPDLPDN